MKRAICAQCGKDLERLVPDDVEDIVCYACAEDERENWEADHRIDQRKHER